MPFLSLFTNEFILKLYVPVRKTLAETGLVNGFGGKSNWDVISLQLLAELGIRSREFEFLRVRESPQLGGTNEINKGYSWEDFPGTRRSRSI